MLSDKTPEHQYRNGTYFYCNDGTYPDLVKAIENDVESLGLKIKPYEQEKCDRSSGYVIAVAVGEKGNEKNFHSMRLNSDDVWESKDGSNPAEKMESGKPPEKLMSELGYNEFVGLFYIYGDKDEKKN